MAAWRRWRQQYTFAPFLITRSRSPEPIHIHAFSKRLGSGHSIKSFLIPQEIVLILVLKVSQFVSYFLNAELSMRSLTLQQICFLAFKTPCRNKQCSVLLKTQMVRSRGKSVLKIAYVILVILKSHDFFLCFFCHFY